MIGNGSVDDGIEVGGVRGVGARDKDEVDANGRVEVGERLAERSRADATSFMRTIWGIAGLGVALMVEEEGRE